MNIIELIIISISLAMDAVSTSICKGLTQIKINIKNSIIIGLYFGIFQSIMPLIGYYLGNIFSNKINHITNYIAFLLILFIGISMIKDSFDNNINNNKLNFKEMIILSVATSIDALIMGITFSILKVNIFKAITVIGIITFILCIIGYNFGSFIGQKYQKKAQIMGGIILIIIGFKILIEHLS